MDVNFTIIDGRLALPPFLEFSSDGSPRARMLVLVRSQRRSRIDVVPIIVSNPSQRLMSPNVTNGSRIRVAGELMRRCSPDSSAPPSGIEVVADVVMFGDGDQ